MSGGWIRDYGRFSFKSQKTDISVASFLLLSKLHVKGGKVDWTPFKIIFIVPWIAFALQDTSIIRTGNHWTYKRNWSQRTVPGMLQDSGDGLTFIRIDTSYEIEEGKIFQVTQLDSGTTFGFIQGPYRRESSKKYLFENNTVHEVLADSSRKFTYHPFFLYGFLLENIASATIYRGETLLIDTSSFHLCTGCQYLQSIGQITYNIYAGGNTRILDIFKLKEFNGISINPDTIEYIGKPNVIFQLNRQAKKLNITWPFILSGIKFDAIGRVIKQQP